MAKNLLQQVMIKGTKTKNNNNPKTSKESKWS